MSERLDFKQKVKEIKEAAFSELVERQSGTAVVNSFCQDIKDLSENANSVTEMDYIMETLNIASNILEVQLTQNIVFGKVGLQDLGKALGEIINESGWKSVENNCTGIFREPVSLTFHFKGIQQDLEPENQTNKESKKTKKNSRKMLTQQINIMKPLKVNNETSSNIDSYEGKMRICFEKLLEVYLLESKCPVPFYNFVINVNSFVQTVYNIYTMSYLIREHLVIMSFDENNQLMICPTKHYVQVNNSYTVAEKDYDNIFQLVLTINPKEWMILKNTLKLTSTILPVLYPRSNKFQVSNEYNELTKGAKFVE